MMKLLAVLALAWTAFFSKTSAAPNPSTDKAPDAHDPPLCVSGCLLFLP